MALNCPRPSTAEARRHRPGGRSCGRLPHDRQYEQQWAEFLQRFHESLKWSPWECAPMNHCGVHLSQKSDGGWILDQKEFCASLNPVQEDSNAKEISEAERRQCRAVLGSAQWRVYQTAPHHAAKLSHLQSILPKGEREVLKEINKFTRELYWRCATSLPRRTKT